MRVFMGIRLVVALLVAGVFGVSNGWAGSAGVGEVLAVAVPVAALGVTALERDLPGGYQLLSSLATTAVVTYGLNLAIDKETPAGDDGAFPSGHTSIAFAGATYLQRRYGWHWGVPAFGAAAVVGWSRIDSDHHDLTDVVGGAVIGAGVAFLLTDRKEQVSVAPWLDSHGTVAGVRVSTPWP
jgi:membrane-associated phospholipid phosphatase